MKPPLRRIAMVLAAFSAAAIPIIAQTPSTVITFKGIGYRQTSATELSVFDPTFGIEVDFPTTVPATTVVQLRGPVNITLSRISSTSYEIDQEFSTAADLNAALPDGTYTLAVSGGGTATNTPLTITTQPSIPPVLITNFDALQALPAGAIFLIGWQPVAGGLSDDILRLAIAKGSTTIFESPAVGVAGTLTGTSTSIAISNLALNIGETASADLTFARFIPSTANGGRTIVVSSYGFNVTFSITRVAPVVIKPAIVRQPQPVAVALGSTAVVSVTATGTDLTYQWKKNGVPIAGATGPAYAVGNAQPATVGTFSVDITNSTGTLTSNSAAITVVSTTDPGRLTNLSILTNLAGAGDFFTLGYVVGNSSLAVPLPLVIRAAGPGLGALGYPGTLADPRLELFAGITKTAENDNWAGVASLKSGFASVGAFPFASDSSNDAAALAKPTSRDNSVRVSATDNGSGAVIAEIYDATPAGTFGPGSPRLVNVSVLKNIGAGLTAGFTIGGSTARTVLIRAVGPSLNILNIIGGVADPKLELFAGQTKIGENDDWKGDPILATTSTAVGAFSLPPSGKDAAFVATLAPGSYTAQVSGVSGATGTALVEVYEVP